MRELIRLIEQPRQCSYLPAETAALEVRAIAELTPAEYGDLLARGYRRFGWQVFRPACPNCRQCRSIRVLASDFNPGRSERRILRANENIRAELHPLFVTTEHVDLYNRYHDFMHAHRGWPPQRTTAKAYAAEFLLGATSVGRQWLYFEDAKLVGVALMDEAPDAISLVYCFYDPAWRARSPGTYSILNQILYAQQKGLRYAYLGYWIEACPSMAYKARFRPHQILTRYPADGEPAVWT